MERSQSHRLSRVDAVYTAITLVALMPLLCVRYPLSVDYLNHMTRLYALTAPATDPIHHYYLVNWHLVANLGLEIFALPLITLLSLESAMKAVWAICVAGMAAGVWRVHRAVHGESRISLLLALPFLYNLPLTMGFFGFTLGIVVALFATAYWLEAPQRLPRLVVFNFLAGLTLLCHVAAGATLGLTIFALTAMEGGGRPIALRGRLMRLARAAGGFILMTILIIAIKLNGPPGPHYLPLIMYSLEAKIWLLSTPSFTGVGLASNIGLAATCLITCTLLFAGRRPGPMNGMLILWLIVLLALPQAIGDASYIDARLPLFPLLLFVAGTTFKPERISSRERAILAALAVFATLWRIGAILPDWLTHDEQVASTRTLGEKLPLGAKVLVVTPNKDADTTPWAAFAEHAPTLWAIDRGAFISTIFTDPQMQPVRTAPQVSHLIPPNVGIVPWPALRAGQAFERDPRVRRTHDARFWARFWYVVPHHWEQRYDYLAVRALPGDKPLSDTRGLTEAGQSTAFRLYRIEHNKL